MSEVQPPVARPSAVGWLFAAGLVAVPFDGVRGVAALGELGNELSFPFFASAILAGLVVSVRKGGSAISSSFVIRVAAAALSIILLSYLVNMSSIHGIVFRERTGFNKFATSLLVILYGFGLAWLAEQVDEDVWVKLVARFVCWSAVIALLYLLIEIPGRAGLLGGAYDAIESIVHSRQADIINPWNGTINEKVLYGWDDRLRSVSFEPPAFGNYTGFAWPWVWYAAVKARPERRLRAWTLLTLFTVGIVAAASRTALMMLLVNVAGIVLLASIYSNPRRGSEALAAARLLLPAATLLCTAAAAIVLVPHYDDIVSRMLAGGSVSNISRSAFQLAGLQIFAAHPVFGVGLGQFSFHVASALPDWAYRSPEVLPMITYPAAPFPTAYSLYVRLGAELGLIGLIGWIALWVGLALLLARRARRARAASGETITMHFPVILNCLGVLLSGAASDTFRTPMIWIALGLGCSILRQQRRVSAAPRSFAEAPA